MRISDWSSDVCSSDLAERDLGDHVGELHLNKLRRRQRATELLPLQRVGTGGMVAGLGRAHRAPGDAVAGAVEAAERTLQPLHIGKEILCGHLDLVNPDLASDRSAEAELLLPLGRAVAPLSLFQPQSFKLAVPSL